MSDTLGPIDIEFNIPEDFGRDADAAIKKMAGITGAAAKLPADVKAAMAEQKSIVKSIENDIKALESSLKTVAPGKAKQELIAETAAAKQALAEEKAALDRLTQTYDQSRESSRRLTMQLRDMQEQLTKMRIAGQQNTDAYRNLEAAAAGLADEIRDVRQVTRNIGDDQAQFKGFADGITGLTGAFSAAGGAVALFAGENENLQKIQTQVQGLMAITIGLQQVSNTLNKDSAFMTVTVVKAKQLWVAAETRLAAALWGSQAAAQALMATLTLGIAVAIPVLISLYNRWRGEQEKAAQAQKEAMAAQYEANAQAAKTRIEMEMLISKLKAFNGSKDDEKRMLDDLNKKYGETFGVYKTLAEWLGVLKVKSDAYVQSMFLQSRIQGLISRAATAETKVQNYTDAPTATFEQKGDGYGPTTPLFFNAELAKKQAEERKKQFIKAAEAERDQLLREARVLQNELQSITIESGLNPPAPGKEPDKTKQTYAEKIAEVKRFYALYKKAIELGQAEAAELFKAKLPNADTYRDYINSELSKATATRDQDKLTVLIPEQEELAAGLKDLLDQYKTYNEQRASIEAKYNTEIAELTKAGYAEKAAIAIEARDKELKALDDDRPLAKLLEKYKGYRKKIIEITDKSNKEIAALKAAGANDEAKAAEAERDREINQLILDNELSKYNQIEEMGKKELRAFIEKVRLKIEAMRAEGKSVELLTQVYDEATAVLSGKNGEGVTGQIENIGRLSALLSQVSQSASDDFSRLAGTIAGMASQLASAVSELNKDNGSRVNSSITIAGIFLTIGNELDKAFGLQNRIKRVEEERLQSNARALLVIQNINAELDEQLKKLAGLTGGEMSRGYAESIEVIQNSILETQSQINQFRFDLAQAPKGIEAPELSIDFLKTITGARNEAEAIRTALAGGLITQDQADIAMRYLDSLEQYQDKLEEIRQAEIEFLTQTNADDLMNQLANAITDAFNSGGDAVLAWGQITEQVMANAVKNALKLRMLEGPINEAVSQLAEDMKDDVLDPAEQQRFRATVDQAAQNYQAALNLYPDLFGTDTLSAINSPERNMFSGLTQKTGNELLGQFTALRMTSAAINDLLQDERQARAAMRLMLEIIAENTQFCRRLETIDNTLKSFETDGIKIR